MPTANLPGRNRAFIVNGHRLSVITTDAMDESECVMEIPPDPARTITGPTREEQRAIARALEREEFRDRLMWIGIWALVIVLAGLAFRGNL